MYTRHNWTTEESITAQKLNYIEDGVSNLYSKNYPASFIIDAEYDEATLTHTLNKTWKEIHENFINGVHCVIRYLDHYPSLSRVKNVHADQDPDMYTVSIYSTYLPVNQYIAASEEGYPTAQEQAD